MKLPAPNYLAQDVAMNEQSCRRKRVARLGLFDVGFELKMKKPYSDRQIVLIVLVVGFGILPLLSVIAFAGVNALNKASMIATTLEWGQLEPFPESARNFEIRTEGSMFTRTIIGSFEDDPETIRNWLNDSPGYQQGTSEVLPDGSTKYDLKTGGGALWVWVFVSRDGGRVDFRAVWS